MMDLTFIKQNIKNSNVGCEVLISEEKLVSFFFLFRELKIRFFPIIHMQSFCSHRLFKFIIEMSNQHLILLILQYLRKYSEDIYFFEVNTKYISSSVLKTSEFLRVRSTSENFDVYNSRNDVYLVFTKKSKFSFYFILFRRFKVNFHALS